MNVRCVECEVLLHVPEDLLGKPVKCRCGTTLICKPSASADRTHPKSAEQHVRVCCPTCKKQLRVSPSLLGKPVKCPCGLTLKINSGEPSLNRTAQVEQPSETFFQDLPVGDDAIKRIIPSVPRFVQPRVPPEVTEKQTQANYLLANAEKELKAEEEQFNQSQNAKSASRQENSSAETAQGAFEALQAFGELFGG